MTDPQDAGSSTPPAIEQMPQAQPAIPNTSQPLQPISQGQGQDQITKLISHPAVKGYLGKSIKIIALFAILGCVLLWGAITALSNIISGALPK